MLSKKIFVGNLPYQAKETQLEEWFLANGFPAHSATIATDRLSGQPRGFGFVEMNAKFALRCISSCNGQDFLGRNLVIDDAQALADTSVTPRTRSAALPLFSVR